MNMNEKERMQEMIQLKAVHRYGSKITTVVQSVRDRGVKN
jgi:hypothetical protein